MRLNFWVVLLALVNSSCSYIKLSEKKSPKTRVPSSYSRSRLTVFDKVMLRKWKSSRKNRLRGFFLKKRRFSKVTSKDILKYKGFPFENCVLLPLSLKKGEKFKIMGKNYYLSDKTYLHCWSSKIKKAFSIPINIEHENFGMAFPGNIPESKRIWSLRKLNGKSLKSVLGVYRGKVLQHPKIRGGLGIRNVKNDKGTSILNRNSLNLKNGNPFDFGLKISLRTVLDEKEGQKYLIEVFDKLEFIFRKIK